MKRRTDLGDAGAGSETSLFSGGGGGAYSAKGAAHDEVPIPVRGRDGGALTLAGRRFTAAEQDLVASWCSERPQPVFLDARRAL